MEGGSKARPSVPGSSRTQGLGVRSLKEMSGPIRDRYGACGGTRAQGAECLKVEGKPSW